MGAVLLAAGLVVYNSLANRWKPFHGWAYVPVNLAMASIVVAIGVWVFGLDRAALGATWASAWIGAAIGGAALVALGALLLVERTRALLRDRRLAGVTGRRAAYMVAVRIPVGTALVEEVVFRGVLLGSLLNAGTAPAVVGSSIAFGLWHLVPTMLMQRANRLRASSVPAGVLVTGMAGVFLGWLRVETGSIASPVVAHAMVNALGAGAAMVSLARAGPPARRRA